MAYRIENQALGDIEGEMMRQTDKDKEERLILANMLSKIVLSSSDITKIGREFAYELKQLISIDWAAIGLIEESKGLLHLFPLSTKLSSDWELGNSIPIDETPFSWLRQHKRALVEPDLIKRSQFWTGAYWLKNGLRTIAYMPLFFKGGVFGGLVFASHHPQAYGDRELKLLKYAMSQISTPIWYSNLLAPVVEESQYTKQTPDENILRMQQLLNNYASVIEVHIEDIKSLTSAIQGFREVWQEHNERVTALDHALDRFMESSEETPQKKGGIVPSIETLKFPPGCFRNRSSALLRK